MRKRRRRAQGVCIHPLLVCSIQSLQGVVHLLGIPASGRSWQWLHALTHSPYQHTSPAQSSRLMSSRAHIAHSPTAAPAPHRPVGQGGPEGTGCVGRGKGCRQCIALGSSVPSSSTLCVSSVEVPSHTSPILILYMGGLVCCLYTVWLVCTKNKPLRAPTCERRTKRAELNKTRYLWCVATFGV